MKIREAIAQADELEHNAYTEEEKIGWLSKLDRMVKNHILDTNEGGEDVAFEGYDTSTDLETELLIPEPYAECYVFWLQSRIHYANREYNAYNAAIEMFNAEYQAYANEYNEKHRPLSAGRFRF